MEEGHPHKPKDNKRLDAVFFNSKHNVVSLKRRTVKIEVNRRAFVRLSRGVFAFLVAVACVGIVGAGYARRTRAETQLYPQTCLGGWDNVAQAEGVPSLDGSDYSAYDDSNSASVSNALSQIYCGDFEGDIPSDTEPVKVTLTLSWAVRHTQPPTVITGDSFASSTSDILESTTSADELIIVSTSTPPTEDTAPAAQPPSSDAAPDTTTTPGATAPDSNSISAPDSTPAPSDTPDNAPQIPDTAPAPAPDTAPADPATPAPSGDSQSFAPQLMRVFGAFAPPRAYAQTEQPASASSSAGDELGTSTPDEAQNAPDGIVEVLYTLDGTTWNSIAVVPASAFSSTSFDIPTSDIHTWDDLSKLQIEIRTISSVDPATTIYLDGMHIDVAYANEQTKEIRQATSTPATTDLQDGSVIQVSDLPSIVVNPVWNDGSTNIIFYQDEGSSTNYVAEARGHGDLPLSAYYAPLPDPGHYIMVEYENDGGNFECMFLSVDSCVADAHFVARTDFEIIPDATSDSDAASSSDANSSDTIAPTP